MAYTAITSDVLSVIKAPPLYEPGYNAGNENSYTQNNIQNNIFQFKTRFIYDNNEKSVFSPPSVVLGPGVIQATAYGYNCPDNEYYNKIALVVTIPDNSTIVKMDIAVRFGYLGIWYLYDTVDVTGSLGVQYGYDFFNDKVLKALDQKDANRPYDYVPILAGAQKIIGGADGAYLTYGDITEGYDNDVTLDVDLSITNQSYTSKVQSLDVKKTTSIHYYIDMGGLTSFTSMTFELLVIGDNVMNRYIIPTRRFWDESGGAPASITLTDLIDQMVTDITGDPVVQNVYRSGNELHVIFHNYIESPELLNVVAENIPALASLKDGATQFFGIVYSDKYGRVAPVLRSADTEVNVPFTTQTNGPANRERARLTYKINHTPPIWAHTWRWVYGGSSIAWFQRFAIRTHDYADRSVWREDGYTKIKINEGINNVRDNISNYIYPNYIWQKGDRLRIIGTRPVTGTDDVNDQTVTLLTEYIDIETMKFDGIYLYVDDWINYPGAPNIDDIDDDIIIEIYKQRRESDENRLYYGVVGEVNAVTNPGEAGRVHANASATISVPECYVHEMPLVALFGDSESPTPSTPTTTSTTTTTTTYTSPISDVFTTPYGIRSFPIYSLYKTPYNIDSRVYPAGEPHIINEDYKQVRLNNVRYSGIHIGKTFINRLNRFDYDDDVAFDDKHGRLFAMEELGYTLKVLQRNKLTSLYIGREMSLDANGNEQLVYTDNVLGSKRPSVEDYGTDQPDGVVVSSRYLYFPDVAHGVIVRDSPNGQEEISKYGMESYIRDLFKYLRGLSTSDYKIIAGVDRSRDMVYFTILDYDTPANTVTLAFDEKVRPSQNGRYSPWRSFYSFSTSIEHYGSVGQKSFLTFLSGALWKHHSDSADRGTFHGEQVAQQELWVVSNVNPAMTKHYEAIELVSNEPWTIADNDSIIIAPNTRYPNGMQSKILSGEWEEYEGVFRASFMKDMLSGDNTTVNLYYLHNGRELSGREMLIKLKNAETGEVNLFLIKVISNLSK